MGEDPEKVGGRDDRRRQLSNGTTRQRAVLMYGADEEA